MAEALEGPVVVLAGAGTGKTRAITHRIAHGVGSGAHDPRRTLAVTFTTRAAGEMRTRLRQLGVDGVQVRTFHAAALRQLRYFWPRLDGGAFPELIPSKVRLVADAARRCGLPTDTASIRDLTADIEWAIVNFLSGPSIGARAAEVSRTLSAEGGAVASALTAYEQIKFDRGLVDFDDILLIMASALEQKPFVADEVHKAYRWFTVDEYQDVNPLQQRLLRFWLGERDDLCVVGDPNQTIYTFTGATPRYLQEFTTTYPQATEVRLVRCYRCTPEIVGLANGVIAKAKQVEGAVKDPLVLRSQRDAGPAPTITAYGDEIEEAEQVAKRARAYIDEGVPSRDIGVLFRINAQSAVLEEAFAEVGVPVVLRGTERFFDRAEVREGVTRLRGAARSGEVTGTLGEAVRAVLGAAGWSALAPRSTGAVRERWESLSALVTLADELGEQLGESLAAFVVELDSRAELQHAPIADGVTLASVHAAKGLEWRVVFVVGCSEGLMPPPYAETPEQIEEERRLAYVAITRAADALHLSWARARQPGGRGNRSVSRFLLEAGVISGGKAGGSVRRGRSTARAERKARGPARCRVCRKGLVTAEERTLGRCRTCPSDLNDELLEGLREWRLSESRERSVPAYVVFTDVTLVAIAEQQPTDEDALLEIPGIGPKKLEAYGETILSLVQQHAADTGPSGVGLRQVDDQALVRDDDGERGTDDA